MVKDWREELLEQTRKSWGVIATKSKEELMLADFERRKSFIENLLTQERNEIVEIIKENGHQQDDDTIWCDIDKVIPLIRSKLSE